MQNAMHSQTVPARRPCAGGPRRETCRPIGSGVLPHVGPAVSSPGPFCGASQQQLQHRFQTHRLRMPSAGKGRLDAGGGAATHRVAAPGPALQDTPLGQTLHK